MIIVTVAIWWNLYFPLLGIGKMSTCKVSLKPSLKRRVFNNRTVWKQMESIIDNHNFCCRSSRKVANVCLTCKWPKYTGGGTRRKWYLPRIWTIWQGVWIIKWCVCLKTLMLPCYPHSKFPCWHWLWPWKWPRLLPKNPSQTRVLGTLDGIDFQNYWFSYQIHIRNICND